MLSTVVRFYRRPTGDSFKKVSALCLPLASQPDPARSARSARHSLAHSPALQQLLSQRHHQHDHQRSRRPPTRPRRSDSDGDEPDRQTDIKAIVNHYQRLLDDAEGPASDADPETLLLEKQRAKKFRPRNIPPQLMKPKLPPSLAMKNRQKPGRKRGVQLSPIRPSDTSNAEDEKISIEPITTEDLDHMLCELARRDANNSKRSSVKSSKSSFKVDAVKVSPL